MTFKKEIYLAIRNKVGEINDIEYVDINRNQYGPGKDNYSQYYTAVLIKITNIQWETMVEQLQEGTATIEVMLYTLDGFAEEFLDTQDADDGLAEIELIDDIADKLQFLYGTLFKPLQQTAEEVANTEIEGLMAYRLTYTCLVYRKATARYTKASNPLKTD